MEPLRASDADRERAAGSLTRHAQEGRLTAEELEQRLERAYAAKTVAELDELQRDLPAERPGAPAAAAGRPPFALLAVLLVAAGLAGTALVGHPIGPLFLLAFVAWWATGRRSFRASAG
jgi:hypothetical protein